MIGVQPQHIPLEARAAHALERRDVEEDVGLVQPVGDLASREDAVVHDRVGLARRHQGERVVGAAEAADLHRVPEFGLEPVEQHQGGEGLAAPRAGPDHAEDPHRA